MGSTQNRTKMLSKSNHYQLVQNLIHQVPESVFNSSQKNRVTYKKL